MTTYNNVVRAKHATLAPAVVDIVNFSTNFGKAEVTNRASAGAGISFRVDGTAPTSLGDDSFWVGPGQSLIVDLAGASDQVQLISATADAYSVTGVS